MALLNDVARLAGVGLGIATRFDFLKPRRFGIAYVDFNTEQRTLKQSSRWCQALVHTGV